MIAGRPTPRWVAVIIAYAVASLVAGFVMSLVEYLPGIVANELSITSSDVLGNMAASTFVYAAIAGVSGLLPFILVAAFFWWFAIISLGAYLLGAALVAAGLVISGFGELSLVPAAVIASFVHWSILRLTGGTRTETA